MKKIVFLLVLFAVLGLLEADDFFTNDPMHRINNPSDGDILSWNSTINAFDCGATLQSTYAGIYHVDADGGGDYTTIQSAITAIEALATAGDYADSKYILKVSPGTYTENLTITNLKYLRIEMAGVKIDGTVTLTTTQQGGDYYSKLEFWGGMSNRPEKGDNAEITGNVTGTRNNDSLVYVTFTGIELSANLGFTSNGTWVVFMNHCYMSNSSGYFYGDFDAVGSPSVLLETMGLTRFRAHISSLADTTTNVSLYDVIDTEFDLIDITPAFGGTVRNCEFKSDVTISASTYEFDNFSYGEAVRQTEDFTGATITFMDNYNGGDVSVVGIISHTAQQAIVVDSTDVTFAVTSNFGTISGFGDGGEVITTITGAGVGLYTFTFEDALVTIEDNDAHTANTIDLLGTDTDLTGADDTVLQLKYDGTSFYEVSRSAN